MEDEEALGELERMGAYGTAVAVIDGEEVVFGFDRKKLEHRSAYSDFWFKPDF